MKKPNMQVCRLTYEPLSPIQIAAVKQLETAYIFHVNLMLNYLRTRMLYLLKLRCTLCEHRHLIAKYDSSGDDWQESCQRGWVKSIPWLFIGAKTRLFHGID